MEEYSNGVIIFISALIPTLISLWLNERVKGSVKNSFDEKLAQFQIDLNHLKSKENFKFTKLHEKRLEVLQQTYQHININLALLETYLKPLKFVPKDELVDFEKKQGEEFIAAHQEFLKYFEYNSIYFDEETEAILKNFFDESALVFISYDKNFAKVSVNTGTDKVKIKNSTLPHLSIAEDLYPIKKEIQKKFRELLGE